MFMPMAAVSVADGTLDSLILPYVNGTCMQLFIDEVAARHPADRIVMVMDGAGWHQGLTPPDNLRLIKLPPYSPELNPVEQIWADVREKYFHNHVFNSLEALENQNHLVLALHEMEQDHDRVRSIAA